MIYCTQCGAPCDEHDAFCKSCGARLGAPQQPAAPAEAPGAQPPYETDSVSGAQPARQQPPHVTENASAGRASGIAREKGGSALFFTAALAFSVMLVFSLFALADSGTALPLLKKVMEKAGYGTFVPLLTQFTATAAFEARVINAVLTGLSAVGIWLLYAALQDKRSAQPSLAGSVVLKISVFAHIALSALVFLMAESFIILIIQETSADSFYTLAALAAIVFAFVLFYFIAPLSLLGSLKRAVRKGQARTPGFTVYFNVVNILIAVYSCLTAYLSQNAFATLGSLARAVFFILAVILVAGYRGAMLAEERRAGD